MPCRASATLLDTRKTIPGLRHLEKYATRMGGAQNHRMGLWDAAMIKDNHVAVAGGVGEAVRRAKAAGVTRIICEVDSLAQIEPALEAGANHLLLDNMSVGKLARGGRAGRGPRALRGLWRRAARHHRRDRGDRGGFVSVGRLTQSAPAADIGLDFTPLHDWRRITTLLPRSIDCRANFVSLSSILQSCGSIGQEFGMGRCSACNSFTLIALALLFFIVRRASNFLRWFSLFSFARRHYRR